MKPGRSAAAVVILGLTTLVAGCGPEPEKIPPAPPAEGWFVDLAGAAGLDFRHQSGATGQYYFPEIGGGGVALFDYDGDGDFDVYLVQGGALGPGSGPADRPEGGRLYRNDRDTGTLRFVDVTRAAGLDARGYGVGAAVGDVDNDGTPDLYLTNYGPNQLWRNEGDGRFTDRTAASGTGESRWSSSAAFVDLDRDGWQDLYVANYTNFTFDNYKECRSSTGNRDYCGPASYEPEPDTLYRNLGGGRFTDVSLEAGVVRHYGAGLGVVAGDYDGNGWPDIYVANDQMANFLWMNREGALTEEGLLSGTALAADGSAQASMGVIAGDVDNDGDEDLFMTHLRGQTNTLYLNGGQGWFTDRSQGTGLGAPSLDFTGFGALFLDYDSDGWLDILAVNGAVSAIEALEKAGDPAPYHQRDQLFRNVGGGFTEVSAEAGAAFSPSTTSRGAAAGDLDNDGALDVVISDLNAPVRVLVNRFTPSPRFLGVRWARGGGGDALGAVATLVGGGSLQRRVSRAAASYASSNDPRILFGLGETTPGALELVTAEGRRRRWPVPPIGVYLVGAGD